MLLRGSRNGGVEDPGRVGGGRGVPEAYFQEF